MGRTSFMSSPAWRERKGARFAKQSGKGEGNIATFGPSSPPCFAWVPLFSRFTGEDKQ